jgi:hypothetical protein
MIGENVDLVARIMFPMSYLSLEASNYRNLGFIIKPYERGWREFVWEERNGEEMSSKFPSSNFY